MAASSTHRDEHASTEPDGALVRAHRTAQGIALRRLAAEIGMSASALSDFETGKTQLRPARLRALCDRLGIALPPEEDASFDDWRVYEPIAVPRVYQAALELFSELGYHGTSMRMIAERVGISVAGLYHHAASKHDLLTWLLERAMAELEARCTAAAAESPDALAQVRAVTECLVRFHADRKAWARLAASELRALEPPARARLWGERARVYERVRASVATARGVAEDDPAADHAAIAIVTMSVAVADWYRPGVDDVEAIAADFGELAVAMASRRPECDSAHKNAL